MGLTTFDTIPFDSVSDRVHIGHIESMRAASDYTVEAKIASSCNVSK